MGRWILLPLLLLPYARACDLCQAQGHGHGHDQMGWDMSGWQQNMQHQQQQQQQQMMMMMMMQQQGMQNWQQPQAWSSTRPQGLQNTITTDCQGFADVVIAMDASGSIGEENFRKQLNFVADVVDQFQVSTQTRSGYRFSVVTYSSAVKEEFALTDHKTKADLRRAITSIQYMGQNTNTHDAMRHVRQSSFRSENGGRYGAVKILIVITDGKSSQRQDTLAESEEIRKMGVLCLAVAVGDDVDIDELEKMTNDKNNIFKVGSFDVLDTIKDALEKRTCDITIEQGGGSTAAFDWHSYLKWCTQQDLMKQERDSSRKILEALQNIEVQQKRKDEVRAQQMADKERVVHMKEKWEEMNHWLERANKMGEAMEEMKHHFMFKVTSEMIKFCPLGDHKEDIMMFMSHGGESWAPGNEEQCNIEEMPAIDRNLDPRVIAEQIATATNQELTEYFFGGLKASVCASVMDYITETKAMIAQNPRLMNFNLMGM